jgi:2-oxoisovalerate dehydrogenase E2 component (dihydrolipoyl transacylase)
MNTFHLPDLGEGLTESEIVAWHVSPGDRVLTDQPLVSVETDKAIVEIPSPQSGLIKEIHGEPGDILAVGDILVIFDEIGKTDAGAVVGDLPTAAPQSDDVSRERLPRSDKRLRATPAVRALAARLGVALETLTGTGPEGAITSNDVRCASTTTKGGGTPLRGVRRSMAIAMTRSRSEIVPATVHDQANIDHWSQTADATLRLIRAIVSAVEAEPGLNAWFDSEREELSHKPTLDLGLAVDRPEGLYVPVLRDVTALDEPARRARIEALKQAVRQRSIALADLTGPTFTLSNFGMIAGQHVSLVIVPPQVGIMGAGRIEQQVVALGGEMQICRMLPLSLTFDHRVVTGGEAARFMAAAIADLEDRDVSRATPQSNTP